MEVSLFTSLEGLKNRINGRKVYAFTRDSAMRGTMDIIDVTVDLKEIEFVGDDGLIIIKADI